MNLADERFALPHSGLLKSLSQRIGRVGWKFMLWTTLINKSLLALVITAAFLSTFNTHQFQSAFAQWPLTGMPTFSSRFATWDGAHYLTLTQTWYEEGSTSCAFYPLWPAAIRVISHLTASPPVFAGLLLANALSVSAFWLFYSLVGYRCGEDLARDSLILMVSFTGALFFSFSYTESLFLTIALAFFWGLERERYFWSFVMAFLMPLTKAVGVFILLPIAWHLYQKARVLRCWPLILAPVLGYALYLWIVFLSTGNAFEGFKAQKAYPYSPSIKNMVNYAGFSHAFLHIGTLEGMLDSALDRGCFALYLILLPAVYRFDKLCFFYVLPVGLVPALTSYFMSYRRYIMICFPLFIVLAQLLARTGRRWIFWYYVILLATLQAWAVVRFVNFNWAG